MLSRDVSKMSGTVNQLSILPKSISLQGEHGCLCTGSKTLFPNTEYGIRDRFGVFLSFDSIIALFDKNAVIDIVLFVVEIVTLGFRGIFCLSFLSSMELESLYLKMLDTTTMGAALKVTSCSTQPPTVTFWGQC